MCLGPSLNIKKKVKIEKAGGCIEKTDEYIEKAGG